MKKRGFDICLSILLLFLFSIFMLVVWIIASIDTHTSGIYLQKRIGQFGKIFTIFKFRTIHPRNNHISKTGTFLRKYKLDELPQLFNVLMGTMSMVGPRPDITGYYDSLEGENRKILELKPGLTSAAALKYVNEETLLNKQETPYNYNNEVIFPDKVKMNLCYYYQQSFWGDIKVMWRTVLSVIRLLKL